MFLLKFEKKVDHMKVSYLPVNKQMMYFEFGPPFLTKKVTIVLDVLFLTLSIIYLVVDWVDVPSIKFLLAVKPIPIFLMIVHFWPVRSYHPAVLKMTIALAWGSVGDILLLIRFLFEGTTQEILFDAGALAFLVGHFFYVLAFLEAAESIAEGKVELQTVLGHKILFIFIWLVLVSFSFYIISGLMQNIAPDSILNYVLPVYGTFLLMLVMGALFFFVLVKGVSKLSLLAAILILVGAVLFFISDNLLAQGAFGEQKFKTKYAKEISLWLMITYYLAQFCLGRGAVTIAAYIDNREGQELKSLSGI